MNNLAPMKNCPGGLQGNLNWMPGYIDLCLTLDQLHEKKVFKKLLPSQVLQTCTIVNST